MGKKMEDKLESVIKELMKKDSINRNCDKWLVINTLRELGFKIIIDCDEVADMPSFETITGIRRKIQNTDGELLATEKTQEAREQKEEEFYSKYAHYKNPVDETFKKIMGG